MKNDRVYIVKSTNPCECEMECCCTEYIIEGVFYDKEKAEKYAKKCFRAHVDWYEVS